MTLASKTFDQLLNFTRASGATRVNDAGLIVGVDFSVTSNTIGTGAKTFTLAADLAVNRDWRVGENVIAVSQAGATGTMTGTVTSYSPASQELVIEVASVTGSGTSTDWRIGSLEVRFTYDPVTLESKGILGEGGATNLLSQSESFSGVINATITPNAGITPSGSNKATLVSATLAGTIVYARPVGAASLTYITGLSYTHSIFVKKANKRYVKLTSNNTISPKGSGVFDFDTGDVVFGDGLTVYNAGGGWFRLSVTSVSTGGVGGNGSYVIASNEVGVIVSADTDGEPQFYLWGDQVTTGSTPTSYIPTTTVSVSRAADIPLLQGDVFTSAINPAQGTLVIEAEPSDGVQGTVVSLSDGTAANEIRIGQKQSGTRSSIRAIASDGVTDVMAVNNAPNNLLRSNGVDYIQAPDQSGVAKFGVASSGVANFLSVGNSQNIRSSNNSGNVYTERGLGGGVFGGAHFGIGRFVIAHSIAIIGGVSIGSVIVSTDGLSFRRINIAGLTQNLNEVTSNGVDQYVAVGNAGVIYTSSDAENWVAQTSGTNQLLFGVHWFGGRYVVVGNTSQIRYSDNGTSWQLSTGQAGLFYDIYHNGTDLWVAVGSAGGIYTSPDGATWTSRASGVTDALRGIHFADGLWVAVGNAGTVVTSPDGITWTDRTATSGTTSNINEVNFFNGKFYFVGNITGGAVFENTAAGIVAGTTWTSRLTIGANAYSGIATNGSRLLICGTSGAIATSDNGTDFTSRTGNNQTLNGAAFGNGTYVVVGNAVNGSGLIATVDPVTFAYQRRVSNTTQNINCVTNNNGRFIAGANASVIRYSDDNGATWSSVTIGGTAFNVLRIVANGLTLLAVGSGGRYSLSADNGVTWSASALTGVTNQSLLGCDFANGMYVASVFTGLIITSPNGTSWTIRVSGLANLYAVHYSTRDQRWYAAGDNGVIVSAVDPTGEWMPIANDAIAASVVGGVVQANPELDNLLPAQTNRVAFHFAPNGYIAAVNDNPAVTDSLGTVPASTALAIGLSGDQSGSFNGYIRKLAFRTDAATAASIEGLASGAIDMFTTEILP